MSIRKPRHRRHYSEVFLERTPESQQVFEQIVRKLSPRWKLRRSYKYYSPKTHVEELQLGPQFMDALTPEARVLEIGAGSARLANYLLKKKKLKPENYELMDITYGDHPPFLKRNVFQLWKEGKMKALKANAFEYEFAPDSYDHILVPHAIVPEEHPEFSGAVGRGMPLGEAAALLIQRLARRLSPALKRGGSIRISTGWPEASEYLIKNKLLPEFRIETVAYGKGIVLRRKEKFFSRVRSFLDALRPARLFPLPAARFPSRSGR